MPSMELKPNAGSDRAWVWNTLADFADEQPKPELLAIRFLNAESEYKLQWMFTKNITLWNIVSQVSGLMQLLIKYSNLSCYDKKQVFRAVFKSFSETIEIKREQCRFIMLI